MVSGVELIGSMPWVWSSRILASTTLCTIGNDGAVLFQAIYSPRTPRWLRDVPAVETLRRVWVQNYVPTEDGPHWRSSDDGLPRASQFVSSPLDLDAHLGRKHTTAWVGYKVHLTETLQSAPD
jgi:transposase